MRFSSLEDLGTLMESSDPEIRDIRHDSRTVRPGDVFVAVPGQRYDGHDFIPEALANGAAALIVERAVKAPGVPVLVVNDSRAILGEVSGRAYNHPSTRLCLVGVTGTNGKTTTAHLIRGLLHQLGHPTGLIGTVEVDTGRERLPGERTTPEATDTNRLLADMVEAGLTHAVMEVSSHALALGRVDGLTFRGAAFTNLTQDHLDFHPSFEAYAAAKARLFTMLGTDAVASFNDDDPYHKVMAEHCRATRVGYGLESESDFRATDVRVEATGLSFTLLTPSHREKVRTPLTGRFNIMNILAAVSLLATMGHDTEQLVAALRTFRGVPGRFEQIGTRAPFTVIVDYAHTPDGLENALLAARDVTRGRVIVVIGCGGDRDRAKRPLMGKVATTEADLAFLTSDNPRSEDPLAILKEMEAGAKQGSYPYKLIPDRRQAIEAAIEAARAGDVVLIAGKGHEPYQVIGDRTVPFDDRIVAEDALTRA